MLSMDFIMEQTLNSIKGYLTTSLTFISLLQQCILQTGHWSKSRDLDLVDTDDYFSLFVALRAPWMLVSKRKAASYALAQLFHVR